MTGFADEIRSGKKGSPISGACVYFDSEKEKNSETGQIDKFVGVRCLDGKLEIHFPVGYRKPEPSTEEKSVRRDVLNLVRVLSEFGEKSLTAENPAKTSNEKIRQFPFSAYRFIIEHFLEHGYYREKEARYKKSPSGKISWNRTIRQIQPNVNLSATGKLSAAYLNFVVRKTEYDQDRLISEIHKFIVHECFSKLGPIFTSLVPEKSFLAFDRKMFSAVVRKKISETFRADLLLLFENMLAVIDYLAAAPDTKDFVFGTEKFHVVWERLVDSVFGEADKEKFYPKVFWNLAGKRIDTNTLRPDTVMIVKRGSPEQKVFVIDSKYYRYGVTGNPWHLPDSASVVKQLAYAQFIENGKGAVSEIPKDVQNFVNGENVFNVFIMPAGIQGGPENSEGKLFRNIGYASADYVIPGGAEISSKSYYRIWGILLDIRLLMKHRASKNPEWTAKLAEEIVNSYISPHE